MCVRPCVDKSPSAVLSGGGGAALSTRPDLDHGASAGRAARIIFFYYYYHFLAYLLCFVGFGGGRSRVDSKCLFVFVSVGWVGERGREREV